MKYNLEELIDLDRLQNIFENFSNATGNVTAILDLEGKVLVATGWKDICTKFHRIHPETSLRCTESDTALAAQLDKGKKYNVYKCMNGLVDVAIPIMIDGEHMGNFFTGQFFFEPPDEDFFRKQAAQYEFDEEAYLDAMKKVPVFSEEIVENTMNFLVGMTVFTAEMGLINKRQAEFERVQAEIAIAKQIQTVLLPEKPEIQGYEIAASCEPADEVGGDYYDVISVAGYDWIVVGDVSGHGVTSGLVMMMVQTAIHTVLMNNPAAQPSDVLASINGIIYENIRKMDEAKHMTIVVLAGGRNGRFSFSGLHEDIMVRRAATGKVENVETDGFWIGMEPDISDMLETDSLILEPGDYMVIFTDGLIEAICEYGMFGNEHLVEIIENSNYKNTFELHSNILKALEFCEKPDDVTLMVIKRT